DLQYELRRAALVPEAAMDVHHRHLDDVGRRPLHHRVDREPLAERARLPVGRPDLGHRPPPAEERRHMAVPPRLLDRPLDEVLRERETREIRADVLLRLPARELELLRGPGRGTPRTTP